MTHRCDSLWLIDVTTDCTKKIKYEILLKKEITKYRTLHETKKEITKYESYTRLKRKLPNMESCMKLKKEISDIHYSFWLASGSAFEKIK